MPDPSQGTFRAPSPADVRTMLSDICTNSAAEVSFDNLTFTINGSDDAVKAAMMVVNRSQYQMRVKIERANEHKEFVSGNKNGKINKIMGQSEYCIGLRFVVLVSNMEQVMCKLSSMASTSTTSTSMCAETSMSQRRTVSISSSRKCRLRSRSMFPINTTSGSLASVASIFSAS